MVKLFFILISVGFSTLLFSQEPDVDCPKGTERRSSLDEESGYKTISCYRKVKTYLFRHGPEIVVNKAGKILARAKYDNGQKVEKPEKPMKKKKLKTKKLKKTKTLATKKKATSKPIAQKKSQMIEEKDEEVGEEIAEEAENKEDENLSDKEKSAKKKKDIKMMKNFMIGN